MLDQFLKFTDTACSIGLTSGFSIFSIEIRWYALSYIFGIILGQIYLKNIIKLNYYNKFVNQRHIENFLLWAMLGIIIGGRLGYIIFYNLPYYIYDPIKIFFVWQGGMSFHGGLIGITISIYLYSKNNNLKFLSLTDLICAAAPIGIFLGRISNFLNGELWGKQSELPWAIIFKCAGPNSRHPSQLYEAFFEGIIIFIVLYYSIYKTKILNTPGKVSGIFCILYAVSRIFIEFFREPDRHIGALYYNYTIGMALSIPLIILGVYLYLKKTEK
ncbi:MAG: prolipoprotein diacylglyceryl transferase [Alphaproteobacteria bacterium]|tara:strand:- start:1553 stop:2368 length:816 start_codon:yes stop_codon:yes gene_type:complete